MTNKDKHNYMRRWGWLGMVVVGLVMAWGVGARVADFEIQATDNCCQVGRQCNTEADWIQGWHDYQTGQCGGSAPAQPSAPSAPSAPAAPSCPGAANCSVTCCNGQSFSDACPGNGSFPVGGCDIWRNEACGSRGGWGNCAQPDQPPASNPVVTDAEQRTGETWTACGNIENRPDVIQMFREAFGDQAEAKWNEEACNHIQDGGVAQTNGTDTSQAISDAINDVASQPADSKTQTGDGVTGGSGPTGEPVVVADLVVVGPWGDTCYCKDPATGLNAPCQDVGGVTALCCDSDKWPSWSGSEYCVEGGYAWTSVQIPDGACVAYVQDNAVAGEATTYVDLVENGKCDTRDGQVMVCDNGTFRPRQGDECTTVGVSSGGGMAAYEDPNINATVACWRKDYPKTYVDTVATCYSLRGTIEDPGPGTTVVDGLGGGTGGGLARPVAPPGASCYNVDDTCLVSRLEGEAAACDERIYFTSKVECVAELGRRATATVGSGTDAAGIQMDAATVECHQGDAVFFVSSAANCLSLGGSVPGAVQPDTPTTYMCYDAESQCGASSGHASCDEQRYFGTKPACDEELGRRTGATVGSGGSFGDAGVPSELPAATVVCYKDGQKLSADSDANCLSIGGSLEGMCADGTLEGQCSITDTKRGFRCALVEEEMRLVRDAVCTIGDVVNTVTDAVSSVVDTLTGGGDEEPVNPGSVSGPVDQGDSGFGDVLTGNVDDADKPPVVRAKPDRQGVSCEELDCEHGCDEESVTCMSVPVGAGGECNSRDETREGVCVGRDDRARLEAEGWERESSGTCYTLGYYCMVHDSWDNDVSSSVVDTMWDDLLDAADSNTRDLNGSDKNDVDVVGSCMDGAGLCLDPELSVDSINRIFHGSGWEIVEGGGCLAGTCLISPEPEVSPTPEPTPYCHADVANGCMYGCELTTYGGRCRTVDEAVPQGTNDTSSAPVGDVSGQGGWLDRIVDSINNVVDDLRRSANDGQAQDDADNYSCWSYTNKKEYQNGQQWCQSAVEYVCKKGVMSQTGRACSAGMVVVQTVSDAVTSVFKREYCHEDLENTCAYGCRPTVGGGECYPADRNAAPYYFNSYDSDWLDQYFQMGNTLGDDVAYNDVVPGDIRDPRVICVGTDDEGNAGLKGLCINDMSLGGGRRSQLTEDGWVRIESGDCGSTEFGYYNESCWYHPNPSREPPDDCSEVDRIFVEYGICPVDARCGCYYYERL